MCLGKHQKMGQELGLLLPKWEIQIKFHVPGFSLAQLRPLWSFVKWHTGREIFLCSSLSLCNFAFHISKINFNNKKNNKELRLANSQIQAQETISTELMKLGDKLEQTLGNKTEAKYTFAELDLRLDPGKWCSPQVMFSLLSLGGDSTGMFLQDNNLSSSSYSPWLLSLPLTQLSSHCLPLLLNSRPSSWKAFRCLN